MLRRTCLTLLAVFVLPVALAGDLDTKKLLSAVSDDATLVVVVPSVNDLAGGLSAFAKSGKVQMLKDIDGAKLLDTLNFPYPVDGVDLAGSLVVAGNLDDDQPILIVTLKDAAAWKKAAEAEDAADGLLKFKGEHEGWAKIKDGQCIISQDKDQLSDALKSTGKFATKFSKVKLGDKTLAAVLIDVPGCLPQIRQGLDSFAMLAQMGAGAGGSDPEMGAAFVKLFIKGFQDFAEQTESFAIATRFDAEGAHMDMIAGFAEKGGVCTYLDKIEKTGGDPLRGLPDRPAMFTIGAEWKTGAQTSCLDEFSKAVIEVMSAKANAEDKKKLDEGLKKWREIDRRLTGFNAGMTVSDSKLALVGQYLTKDAQDVFKAFGEYLRETSPIMGSVAGMGMEVTTTEEKLGETPILASKMQPGKDNAQREMIEAVYGKDLTMIAAPSKEGMYFALAGDAAARKLITSVLDGKSASFSANKHVQKALGTISPKPPGIMIIDIGECINGGAAIARTMGAPIPPMKAPTGALVACGAYLEKATIRLEIAVPATAVKAIVELGENDAKEGGPPVDQ